MSSTIEIIEVGPRDGLQNESTILSVDQRVELIGRLVANGARRLEAVSFVRGDLVPQMASAEKVLEQLDGRPDVTYIGLVLNQRGAERAAQASNCGEINIVVPVTDEFSSRNQNCSVDQMIGHARDAAAVARQAQMSVSVTLAVAFGCPFAGPVGTGQVRAVVDRVADLGVDEIAFADTIGVGLPHQVEALAELARLDARIPKLRFHFHNTRNTGYTNAHTAAQLPGIESLALDASVGGFGGCPFAPRATGNIATEDLIYLLRGRNTTQLHIDKLADTALWLADQLHKPTPGLLSKAGDFPSEATA